VNRTLQLFRVADAAAASLSGGHAPRSWRRECARRAARLRALSRAARWDDALIARAPGLTDTPLWGECLAELTTLTSARTEDAPARSRPSDATTRGGATPPARPAHAPGDADRARRQTSSRRTSAARAISPPPPLPRAFQPHAASVAGQDARLSDLNHADVGDSTRARTVADFNGHDEHANNRPLMSEPRHTSPLGRSQDDGGREQLDEGSSADFRARPGAHFNENQGAHFDDARGARAPSARAGFDPPEVFAPSEDFPSSVRGDAERRESGEAFAPDVEGLSREASHELLCRLAGHNGSSPVQHEKSSRVAPSKHSGAAASKNFGTAPSKNYGVAPSLAEARRSNGPPAQRPYNSPRGRTPDALVYRGSLVRLPDANDARSRSRQWWSVLAARTAVALRRSGALPAAPGRAGASLLTEQLFFTVNGEMAPQDLLTRLAGGRVAASGAARQSAARRGGGHQSSAPRAPQGETPQPFFDAGPNVFTTGDESAFPANQSGSPGLDPKQLPASATAEASAPGVNTSLMSVNNYLSGAETSLPGVAVSPVVAESLPPLLPPPLVGMPVLPIALATAREGARDESRETAEDLDALAAKIKLILDEQARRHGIDV
jgi:hypothetical protein